MSVPVYGFVAAAVSVWGVAFVAIAFALRQLSPAELTFMRYVPLAFFAGGYLLAFHRKTGASLLRRRWPTMILMGLLVVPIYNLLLFFGQERLSPPLASLLGATAPLWAWAFATSCGQEKADWLRLAGVVCAVCGVWLAVRGELSLSGADWRYVLAAVAAAVVSAAYTILSRSLLQEHEPLLVMALALVVGAVPAVFLGGRELAAKLPALAPATWASVAFLSFASSWCGMYFWYKALRRLPATHVIVAVTFIPLVAMGADAVLRGAAISSSFFAGALLSAAGIACATWR